MKALIEKVLLYLPQYLTDFGAIISGPKAFIVTKNTRPDSCFNQALLFLGMSIALSVILRIPSLTDTTDVWQQLSLHGVTILAAVSMYSVILRLAWRMVGGKASIKSFFVTYAYFGGVFFILGLLIEIIKVGAFKTIDLALYEATVAAKLDQTLLPANQHSDVLLLFEVIDSLGTLLIIAFGWVCWGAYRELNQLSKMRSFCAFLIQACLGWISFYLAVFIYNGLS